MRGGICACNISVVLMESPAKLTLEPRGLNLNYPGIASCEWLNRKAICVQIDIFLLPCDADGCLNVDEMPNRCVLCVRMT